MTRIDASTGLWSVTAVLLGASCVIAAPHFTDVTEEAGIDFSHVNGANGRKYIIETVGAGGAFLDADGDGKLDIYLINGAEVPGTPSPETKRNALYLNRGGTRFVDVTGAARVGDTSYGMGCAAADIDNDGDLDLFLSNFGPDVLYRNEGNWPDGHFIDITETAGVGDGRWSTSSAFADVDADGLVDLYVATYTSFTYDTHRLCSEGGSGLQLYCGPEAYDGVPNILYRNRGNGRFEDITEEAGLFTDEGKDLGVVFGDVDGDGDPDLYVANDRTTNQLFVNDGQGRFEEMGFLAGAAFNEDGEVEAGMGVDMGDIDNDGLPDLFVTNFQWETNTLYHNLGDGMFMDETYTAGLGMGSIARLSWGTRIVDLDNDGDRDIIVAAGHLESDVEQTESTTFPQRNQLYLNDGTGRFVEHKEVEGTALAVRKVSRGAATGDYDDDGDLDVLVTNCAGTPTLLRNDGGNENNWLSVRLEGTVSNRAAIGAKVEVVSGDLRQVDEVRAGSSYLSQSDLRLFFGLGSRERVDRLKVMWPSGLVEVREGIPVNGEVTLIEAEQ